MNRRRLVSAIATGAVGCLAGCFTADGDTGGPDDGDDPEPLDGEWTLRARVVNEDDEPREWRVESRSTDRESVAAASGTLPAGGETELALSGHRFEERREVCVESEAGAVSEPWRPADCRRLFADVTIVDGTPDSGPTVGRTERPMRGSVCPPASPPALLSPGPSWSV
jgi:hypothetical protein